MDNILLSPLTIRGVTLKNRLVFAPATLGLTDDDYVGALARIARGGAGLIVVGDVPVLPAAPGSHGPDLYSPEGTAFYRRVVEAVHAAGAKAAAQLHQSDSDIQGMMRFLPDIKAGKYTGPELRQLLNGLTGDYITNLPLDRVQAITAAFGEAARRCAELGFDVIQVHGDRMCGSFSSAVYNARTDEYGGTPEHRARFAVEAVSAVRAAAPDLPLDYKLAVRQEDPHYGNAGVLVEELGVFVPLLERAGVDSFHVALANHGDLSDTIPPANHPAFRGEGCFLGFCDQVRQYTALPLCGVGGLTDPDFVEAQLASGRIQLAALCRQLIADPDWLQKIAQGRTSDIRRCVRCNRACLGGMQSHQGVHCIYDETGARA